MAAPNQVGSVYSNTMSGTSGSVTKTGGVSAGNTVFGIYIDSFGNRAVLTMALDGVSMTRIGQVNSGSNAFYAELWAIENVAGGSGVITAATSFSTTADLLIIEIGPSVLDTSDTTVNASGTSHRCADSDKIDTVDNVFIIAVAIENISRTMTANASYTRVTLPSSILGLVQTRVYNGSALSNEGAVWTTDNPTDSAGIIASYKSVVAQPSRQIQEHIAYGSF